MSEPAAIKPTDKNIADYLSTLSTFITHSVTHEGATEKAFSHLLADPRKVRCHSYEPEASATV